MVSFINIAITTSVTALIILMVKRLLNNKISPKWQFALWFVLAVRLLVPVLPESNISVFNSVPQVKNIETVARVMESIEPEVSTFVKGNIVVGDKDKEFVLSKTLMDIANNARGIWIMGSIVMFLYMVAIYGAFHLKSRKFEVISDADIIGVLEECKKKLDVNSPIMLKLGGKTPLLKGILKPQIIVPEGYTKQELKSVFLHELMHFKNRDISWNIIGTLLLCAYWYNPLMWYCFFVFRRDMEVFCDYNVLQVYDNKKEYASVLLKTALKKNKFMVATTSMQNGEKDVTKRIKQIAYYKKPKFIWSIVAIIVACAVTGLCLTNAVGDTQKVNNVVDGLNAEKLYQCKTPYIGNASNIGNLISNLHYAEYRKGMSLQTSSKPYGVTVKYLIKSKELISNGVVAVTDKMLINATVILSLIDNVDNVTFAFNDGRGVYSFPFNRDLLNDLFDKDLREYSSSLKVFKEEFIPTLERKDWSALRIPTDLNVPTVSVSPEIGKKVEDKLEIIMSSPQESSSQTDYIKAHQYEYEDVIKMGDDGLEYMLSLFESGEAKGLKAHIMMKLCIEILEDRNNVEEGSYNSPEEWYAKPSPITATKLPPFSFTSQDKIEQMVYSALIEECSNNKKINKS
ncbi:MAG: M56 family metallopeptidase, partial [Clostridia bacterium]|nr:M56 family metallopeptidase [Clostridia bacterium]